jgi:hypothetical protein
MKEMLMKRLSLLLLVLAAPASAFAQFPGKGLRFAQIAVGGGYETVLNVTNRGSAPYNGMLRLLPSDPSQPFPALVNGNPLSGGATAFTLNPGATATFRITSGNASAGTLSGFALVGTPNAEQASLLEGNLTYYVRSADGTISGSVGVAPSRPFIHAVIPFDEFESIALALANGATQTANVRLTVFDDKGSQVATTVQTLTANQQLPKFLYQFFPGVALGAGRVEIFSPGVTILGTALTFKDGHASSLPFLPPVKLYDITLTAGTETYTAQAYIAVDFSSATVTVYAVDTVNGVPQPGSLAAAAGYLRNGNLEVFDQEGSDEISHIEIPSFNMSAQTLTGKIRVYSANPPGVQEATITLKAVN